MSLVVVGSMAFDAIETPFGKSDKIIGGAGTYIAWSASNFCKPIKQISVVGGDFPQQELNALTERGVNVEGVQIKKDEKTFFWSGRYHMDMNTRDTLDTQLNAWKSCTCCTTQRNSAVKKKAEVNSYGYYELLDGNCFRRPEGCTNHGRCTNGKR
jgi:hypothetical protein